MLEARQWKLSELEYVWTMRQRGVTYSEIGLKLGRSGPSVQSAWRRIKKTGPIAVAVKPIRHQTFECKLCSCTITRHNTRRICQSCQNHAMIYDCGECGVKINYKRHAKSGLCLKCYDKHKAKVGRERAAGRCVEPMSRDEQNARASEASMAVREWPLGKPRGRVAIRIDGLGVSTCRCPISPFAADAMAQFSTPERAMYAAMIRAGVALGDPAEDRVTSSHRPSLSSPAAQVAGAFGGRAHD